MLRISGGELRGRPLQSPREASGVRPTTERVREAIFSILGPIDDTTVLDLFCGTGALGIEALSRGASHADLIDSHPLLARRNVRELGLDARARVVRADALQFLRGAEPGAYDLVLCDPPYTLAARLPDEFEPLLGRVLAPGGRIVIETSPRQPVELGLPLQLERRYGDSMVRVHRQGAER